MEIEKKEKNVICVALIVSLLLLCIGMGTFIFVNKTKLLTDENSNITAECDKKDNETAIDNNNENSQNVIEMNYEQSYNYLINYLKCEFYDARSFCNDTFYISAKCDNDLIKNISYNDIVHYRTENSSGIFITINEKYSSMIEGDFDENAVKEYYKILEKANIKGMELINGMKYAYEIADRNQNVVHNSYCD